MYRKRIGKIISALLVSMLCFSVLGVNEAKAIKYPVEIYYKTVYSNNLGSVDYTEYYNKYGYSYVVWYSVSDKKLKIVFPDDNYEEKSYSISITDKQYILGPYKNYIIYYTVSSGNNTFYKIDINTGQVSTIFSKSTGSSNISVDMSKEGTIAIASYSSTSFSVYTYNLQTNKMLYDKSYSSQIRAYNSNYRITSLYVKANGQNVAIEERYMVDIDDNEYYSNYSHIDGSGTRRGNLTLRSCTKNTNNRYYLSFMATKNGLIAMEVYEDRRDDEYSTDIYVIRNGSQSRYQYDGEFQLVDAGRYIGSPYCVLVGNDEDNAGVIYENKNFSGSDSREYTPSIFYTNSNIIYGTDYRSRINEFKVDEVSRTISVRSLVSGDIIRGEYDPISERMYVLEFLSGGVRRLSMYDKEDNGFELMGMVEYEDCPALTETNNNVYEITNLGLSIFKVKFAEDVVSDGDKVAPIVDVRTNPEKYTNNRNIQLSIEMMDNKDSVDKLEMSISVDGGSTYSGWEKYTKTKKITLPLPNGEKKIVVRARDTAGNIGVGMCNIMLGEQSSAPPDDIGQYNLTLKVGSETINKVMYEGIYVYPVKSRHLSITMDSKNALDIKISDNENDPTNGIYQQAKITSGKINHDLILRDYDGIQTYFVQLRNMYLAENNPMKISLMLDRQAPIIDVSPLIEGQRATTQRTISLKINASDNVSSKLSYRINNGIWKDLPSDGKINYSDLVLGYNNIKVEIKDLAGNVAEKHIEIFRLE